MAGARTTLDAPEPGGTVERVVAFDVDGTVTSRDCVVPFLRRVGGTSRIVAGLGRRPLALAGAAARRDRDRLKALATSAALRGRVAAEVVATAGRFAAEVYEDRLRAEIVGSLRRHLADGDTVVFVSASYEVYLRPLAGLLGVGHVLGTRLAVADDGTLTGDLDGPNCRAGEKVRRLDAWLGTLGRTRGDIHLTAYGDSGGDRELLLDADVAHWVGRGSSPPWLLAEIPRR